MPIKDSINWSMGNLHCGQRVFRTLVKLHSHYTCSELMNAKTDTFIQAQVHTLHRVTEKNMLSDLRTVQHTELMKQYRLSVAAMQ